MDERWATFDCYGTLIDWDGGIGTELARLFGAGRADALLARYHELEPVVEANGYASYRDVMRAVLEQLAAAEDRGLPARDRDALARSLPAWPPFPEVRAALAAARERGWRLAVLSNSDRDLIAASIAALGVPVDHVVVAEDVGSYKPAHAHWERFFADTGADPRGHVHVAASVFHDVAPAAELGLRCVWVNRRGEPSPLPPPTRELVDLRGLASVLDELVPA